MGRYHCDDVVAFCEAGEFFHLFVEVAGPHVLDVGVVGGEDVAAVERVLALGVPLGLGLPVVLLHLNQYEYHHHTH